MSFRNNIPKVIFVTLGVLDITLGVFEITFGEIVNTFGETQEMVRTITMIFKFTM